MCKVDLYCLLTHVDAVMLLGAFLVDPLELFFGQVRQILSGQVFLNSFELGTRPDVEIVCLTVSNIRQPTREDESSRDLGDTLVSQP